MLAGIVAVANAMFLSPHDLRVVLLVLPMAGLVSLGMGWMLGRRLARAAMWLADAREKERQAEASRRDLVAGSRTTCVRRWPGCARWPRRSRTAWSATRPRFRISPAHSRGDRTDGLAGRRLFELSRISSGTLRLKLAEVAWAMSCPTPSRRRTDGRRAPDSPCLQRTSGRR
jgi:hypothetical protein